jgi:hypothetical protein
MDDLLTDMNEVAAILDSEQDFLSNEEMAYSLALAENGISSKSSDILYLPFAIPSPPLDL